MSTHFTSQTRPDIIVSQRSHRPGTQENQARKIHKVAWEYKDQP